ncbi:MAG: hypothetical protein RI909_2097 [Bacteroidota bacterium]
MLLAVCCLLAVAGWTQPTKTDLLVKNVWKLQSDEMSGLGVHTSLPKDIELTFLADGTWKSSQPINEVSVGKWRLENSDRNFVMTIGKEETRYLILQVTEKELRYRVKKNAATYTYTWLSK